jgi:signal transduction histidine kinase
MSERFLFLTGAEQAAKRLSDAIAVRNEIILADEKLTMSAIAYTYSNSKDWKARYAATVPDFNVSIGRAKSLVSAAEALSFDHLTKDSRGILAQLEQTSFDLVEGGWAKDAPAIFKSPRYLDNKKTVVQGTDNLLALIDGEAGKALSDLRMRTWILLTTGALLGLAGAVWMWRRLNRALDKAEKTFIHADAMYHQQVASTHAASIKSSRMEQLGALTATVAHELRNPLGAVRTSAFMLERKFGEQDESVKKSFERIRTGVTRCDNIISQLIDFSRTPDLEKSRINFDDWLAGVLTDLSQTLHSSVSLTCELGIGEKSVRFDHSHVRRAVGGLITNASEAIVTKDGIPAKVTGGTPRITVETRLSQRGAEIVISDNGPGIAAENIGKVMEPLFTTKSFGAGLGLPAAQRILEQHGGGIEIASSPGQGTCVTAWIAVADH